jgi:hypothetical protein
VPAKAVVITEHRSSPAREDPDDDTSPLPRTKPVWYGWQTLAADAATVSIFITAGLVGDRRGGDKVAAPIAWAGLASYEFAPGIVHFAHRNPGRGFASFGIRIGLPLAGALLGATLASGCEGFECEAGGAAVGALLGLGGAVAIDAAVFAYEDPPSRVQRRVRVAPQLMLGRQRAIVGLTGWL